jgi:hypothetical protein
MTHVDKGSHLALTLPTLFWQWYGAAMPLLVSIVIGLSGVVWLFLPTFLAGDSFVPSRYPDTREVLWTIYYTKRFLVGDVSSLYDTRLLFHPFGASLYLHTTVEALTFPLTWFFATLSEQRIYTIACASCFLLNYLAALRLMCAFRIGWMSRTAGAWLIAFHPFFIARLDAGHLNFLCFFGVLLLLHAVVSVAREQSGRLIAVESFVAGVVLIFTNAYYVYMAALIVAMWGVVIAFAQRRMMLRYCMVVVLPIVLGIATGVHKVINALSLAASRQYTPDHDPIKNSIDVVSLLVPGTYQVLGGERFADLRAGVVGNAIEQSAYLGWGLLLLVIVALCGARLSNRKLVVGILAVACFSLVMSFGPVVHSGGVELFSNPVYRMVRMVSPLMLSVPARFALLALMHLFIAVALVGECIHRRTFRAAMAVVLAVLVCEYLPASVEHVSITRPTAVAELAHHPEIQAVHDFSPTPWDSMFNQIGHGKSVTGGFLSRRPREVLRFYKRNEFLKFTQQGKEASPEQLHAALAALQIQAVIVPRERADITARLTGLGFTEVIAQDEQVLIYRVPLTAMQTGAVG